METDKYILVGMGGTGSMLLDQLVRFLTTHYRNAQNTWELLLVDGDDVEEKNLDRQLYDESAIKANKAVASASRYSETNKVFPVNEYLGKDNIDQIITDGSTVLIGVDNYPVRALIQKHCLTLDNAVVINGGNEVSTGSCQLWVRKDGANITPVLTFLHPEISNKGADRATMTCAAIAALDGGEQLITANMASAMWILTALMMYRKYTLSTDKNTALIEKLRDENKEVPQTLRDEAAKDIEILRWTDLQFDLDKGESYGVNMRGKVGWDNVATE